MIAALRQLAGRRPRAAVVVAHWLAALTRPLGHGIAEERIAAAFPALAPAARRAVRRRTWAGFLKGEAVDAAVARHGGARAYPRVVPNPSLEGLRPPLILASFHVGPYPALGAALAGSPVRVVGIDRGQYGITHDLTTLAGGEDEWERARTFQRSLSALRSESFVIVMLDGQHPEEYPVSAIEVPVLGRRLPLARGAFALARLARTPVVPIVARWRGTAIEVTLGDPIAPELGEAEMAAAAGEWIDRYLRERPGEITVFMLDRLTPAPTR